MAESNPSATRSGVMVAETELHAGALSFPAVLAQSIALVSPTFALLLSGTFIASQVGYAMPITYLGGAFLIMAIALTLFPLAKRWPSAGGYFTYASRALHPRVGFIVAWAYIIYGPLVAATTATIVGFLIQNQAQSSWNITIPWWLTTAVIIGGTSYIAWRGIKASGRALVILAFIEIAILLAFGITGFLKAGSGGISLSPFTFDPHFGVSGFALGVIYVIFAYAGFESAVYLAEESRNPRKYIPWALVGSVAVMTVFFVFAWWGIVTGWGINDFDKGFAGQPVGAFFTLGQRLWGPGWILLLFVLLNATFGINMGAVVYNSRMFFAHSRAGVLPAFLGRTSNRVPRNAIIAYTVVALVWCYGAAILMGPDQAFFWTGLLITWALIFIFFIGAVGVFWHWFHALRSEFNWFWNLLVPLVAVVGLGLTAWSALPSLTGSFFWTLPIVIVWLLIGVGVLLWFRATKREGWLLKATLFAAEHEATAVELAELDQKQ